jgi:RNA polymerase sigma-70 factor (sigma-E family)
MTEVDASSVHGPPRPAGGFEDLYEVQYLPMVRLAHVLVDTVEQAEEVVQDAFAAVYLRWSRLDNPGAYLRVAVLNGARKQLRRRRVARRSAVAPSEPGELEFNHVLDAVRRLPHRQRAVVVLRYELQLSEADIATTLGIPAGTVKSTRHRALARLREEVER